jgi:Ser/Thr protein kinase RdoA (MazF antagonist)
VVTESLLASWLTRYWGVEAAQVSVHNGGMGSATWFVEGRGDRWVAKLVAPAAGSQFTGGLAIAQALEGAGIPAGAALPARDGQLAVDVGQGWLALLTWVPGHPLTGESPAERELIGTTLAGVHAALAGRDVSGAQRFHWVDPAAEHLALRPWLRPAVSAAVDGLAAAGPENMTWGLLHADPAPETFLCDPVTGRCGIIDWSYFLHGPLLYDLASAVMYVGGRQREAELIAAYLSHGLLDRREVAHGLDAMLRFRWAVQADYFARRITENDMTGISGPWENEKGLEDARRFLLSSASAGS